MSFTGIQIYEYFHKKITKPEAEFGYFLDMFTSLLPQNSQPPLRVYFAQVPAVPKKPFPLIKGASAVV
jgi:hypothetical protein